MIPVLRSQNYTMYVGSILFLTMTSTAVILSLNTGYSEASYLTVQESWSMGGMRKLLHGGHTHVEIEASGNKESKGKLLASKGASIIVFFLVPFIGVWIPFFFNVNQEMLKYGLLYASGLFFALALQHLASHSAQGFAILTDSSYPFAYMLVVVGYLLTWLTDLVVHGVWERKEEKLRKEGESKTKLEDEEVSDCCKGKTDQWKDESREQEDREAKNCDCEGNSCRCKSSALEYIEHQEVLRVGAAIKATFRKRKVDDQLKEGSKAEVSKKPDLGLADLVLLVVAMCFHAVFEGLAVGLQTTVSTVWKNTGTIVVHKIFEGAALGAALKAQDAKVSWTTVAIHATMFSIMAPVGIAIGMILESSVASKPADWVAAIGNGIAAGVFIFVCVSHLMVKGFRKGPNDRWFTPIYKWVACMLGVISLALLMIIH